MNEIASVTACVPLADFHARVTFSDGTTRDINLLPYIDAGGVFTPIHDDPAFFRAMTVENDTISWPNGADIDPDSLRKRGRTLSWTNAGVRRTATF